MGEPWETKSEGSAVDMMYSNPKKSGGSPELLRYSSQACRFLAILQLLSS